MNFNEHTQAHEYRYAKIHLDCLHVALLPALHRLARMHPEQEGEQEQITPYSVRWIPVQQDEILKSGQQASNVYWLCHSTRG